MVFKGYFKMGNCLSNRHASYSIAIYFSNLNAIDQLQSVCKHRVVFSLKHQTIALCTEISEKSKVYVSSSKQHYTCSRCVIAANHFFILAEISHCYKSTYKKRNAMISSSLAVKLIVWIIKYVYAMNFYY